MRSKTPPTRRRERGEERTREERQLVAAVERLERRRRPTRAGVSVREAAMLARTARPSAPPIMNEVLTTPDARPASLRLDVAHRGEQHRVEGDARADAEQDHPGQDVDDERAVDRRAGEQQQAERGQPEARDERRADPVAHHELRRDAEREHAHDQVAGRNARPT